MTGWYIVAIVLGLVGMVVASKVSTQTLGGPSPLVADRVWLSYLYSVYKRMSEHYRVAKHRFVIQKGLLSRTDNRILLVDIDDITVHRVLLNACSILALYAPYSR